MGVIDEEEEAHMGGDMVLDVGGAGGYSNARKLDDQRLPVGGVRKRVGSVYGGVPLADRAGVGVIPACVRVSVDVAGAVQP